MNRNKDKIESRLTELLAKKALTNSRPSTTGSFSYSETCHQYDIGRNRITSFDPKSIKDTYYKFRDEVPKRFGDTVKPISTDVGSSAWEVEYSPPSFGGKSLVKNFFDKSHLSVSHR